MAFTFDSNYAADVLNLLGLGETNPFLSADDLENDVLVKQKLELYINDLVDFDTLSVDEQEKISLGAKYILAGIVARDKLPLIYPQIAKDHDTSITLSKVDFTELGQRFISDGEELFSSITGLSFDISGFIIVSPTVDIITGS